MLGKILFILVLLITAGLGIYIYVNNRRRKSGTESSEEKDHTPTPQMLPAPTNNMTVDNMPRWTGSEKLTGYVRMCVEAKHANAVDGMVLEVEIDNEMCLGLMSTGEYTCPEDVPKDRLSHIDRARFARPLNNQLPSDGRLLAAWLFQMTRRLKEEAATHEAAGTAMMLPDWYKSVLDLAALHFGKVQAWKHVEQMLQNTINQANPGERRGTATLGNLNVQIHVHITGFGTAPKRHDSSFGVPAFK